MKRVVILTALAALLLSGVAIAQPGGKGNCDMHGKMGRGHGGGHGMGQGQGMKMDTPGPGMLLRMADELELTDQQKEQFKSKMTAFQAEKIDREADLKKAKVMLRAAMMNENPNATEVNSAIDEVARYEADLKKMKFKHHQEMRGLLTDAQQDKLKELRKDRMMNRGDRMGQGKGQRGGKGGQGGPGMGWLDDDTDTRRQARMNRVEEILGDDGI